MFLFGTSFSTILTYTFVSQIIIDTFTRLNDVWNIDRPKLTLSCRAAMRCSTSWPAGSELSKRWLYRSGSVCSRPLTKA